MSVILPQITLLDGARELAEMDPDRASALGSPNLNKTQTEDIEEATLHKAGQEIVDAAAAGVITIFGWRRDGTTSDKDLLSTRAYEQINQVELGFLLFSDSFGLVPKEADAEGYFGDPLFIPPSVRRRGWARPCLDGKSFRTWMSGPQQRSRMSLRSEHLATEYLASKLRDCRDLRKEDAQQILADSGYRAKNYRFQNSIWPNAREAAGLDRKASAGRKRKIDE